MNRAPCLSRPTTCAIFFSFCLSIGAVAGGGWPGGTARASIVVAMDLPDLVRQADHIAVVDVVASRAEWDANHQHIYSTIDLNVVERWKGTAAGGATGPDRITIVQPGGTVGDLTMTVTGLSAFTPGERALVFVRGEVHHAQLVGMTQGKRPVRFETVSGRWLVHPPNLRQATLVHAPSPSSTIRSAGPIRPPSIAEAPLDDLRSQVQALLGTPAR